MVTLHGL